MHAIRVPYEIEGWGLGELWAGDGRLVSHELPHPRPKSDAGPPRASSRFKRSGEGFPRVQHERVGSVTIGELIERLGAYFAGDPATFDDIALDLDPFTPFQRDIAAALRAVPYGETVTYGELAAIAGRPNAQRAAGTFCGRNRYGLIVPCHRVVAADGLGSYGSLGVEYKRRLLTLEHAV